MAKYLVSDGTSAAVGPSTTLATGISSGATSMTVASGNGALFPSPNPATGTKFLATLESATNPNTWEVVTVTNRSTDTMTTTPTVNAYSAGDYFSIRCTAELIEQLVQFDDLQAQSGNYAADSGSANAYVVGLTPSLSAHVTGLPIRWKAAHANTGASTLNDGAGAASILYPSGASLIGGEIIAGQIYTCIWNSTLGGFQLSSAQDHSLSTFTFTVSGPYSTTLAASWSKDGNKVTVWSNSSISGTAGSSSPIYLTGLPTEIQPAQTRIIPCAQLALGGYSITGWAQVNPNGTAPTEIRIDPISVVAIGGINYITDASAFPSGSICGLYSGWSITYSL